MCWLGSGGVEEGIPRQKESMSKACLNMLLLGKWVETVRSLLDQKRVHFGEEEQVKIRKLNCGPIMNALESQGEEFRGAAIRSDGSCMLQ